MPALYVLSCGLSHDLTGGSIKIPFLSLSSDALLGVVDEYVTREGTDYGHLDYTLEDKRALVLRQLERGQVVVTFNPDTGTTSIVPADELDPADD